MKRLVDAEGRTEFSISAMREVRQRRIVRMIDFHKTNKRSIDELDEDDADLDSDVKHRKHGEPPHQLQLHGPAQQESPEPVANDAATEPNAEVLDSPADADEFQDAIDQMDRQIDQLEKPPGSPFSCAPTTPAETVIEENDEPNANANIASNDDANANTTATLPANMPADTDLPICPLCHPAMVNQIKMKWMVPARQLTLCLPAGKFRTRRVAASHSLDAAVRQMQQLTLCLLALMMTSDADGAE